MLGFGIMLLVDIYDVMIGVVNVVVVVGVEFGVICIDFGEFGVLVC